MKQHKLTVLYQTIRVSDNCYLTEFFLLSDYRNVKYQTVHFEKQSDCRHQYIGLLNIALKETILSLLPSSVKGICVKSQEA